MGGGSLRSKGNFFLKKLGVFFFFLVLFWGVFWSFVGERTFAIWAKVWNILLFLIVGSCVVDPSIRNLM